MSKFLGFLLGIVVALVGPAMFGVLAADGGIKLNTKEMALAYGIGALIFWTVVSYFSGAAALGAALTFGTMIYMVLWIPNRMTNFLNDVPGVTTGMIEGIKQYTLNGVVPILAVISLIYAIQLIVQTVQRRRRERAEADRRQREQELAQAQQEAEATSFYPVAGGDYQPSVDNRFGSNFGNDNYDDLFDEDPTSYPPRNQADEQTTQFANANAGIDADARGMEADADADRDADNSADGSGADETLLVPTDRDETVTIPAAADSRDGATNHADQPDEEVTVQEAPRPTPSPEAVAEGTGSADNKQTEVAPAPATPAPATSAPATPSVAPSAAPTAASPVAPAPAVPKAAAPAQQPDEPRAAAAPTPKAAAAPTPNEASEVAQKFEKSEQMGQPYRERMDGPELDDTGEFHINAFENPNLPDEGRPQAPRMMDLPGQFRPAGA